MSMSLFLRLTLFSLYICDEVIQLSVAETNQYAEHVKERKGDGAGSSSRVTLWKPVTIEDMKALNGNLIVAWPYKTLFIRTELEYRSLLGNKRLQEDYAQGQMSEHPFFLPPCRQHNC